MALPVIDIDPLTHQDQEGQERVARLLDAACRDHGFFVVTGHGVDLDALARLEALARAFFALPEPEKAQIAMRLGGRAWRGWFPVGGELTYGVPDGKEGIYFGAERPSDERPMHGPNLFPARPEGLRDAVLAHLDTMSVLGTRLVAALDRGLGADGRLSSLVEDPLPLFRIFHYPPGAGEWGVAEHTDYGLLTILHQDEIGGLQVRGRDGWIDVPPVPGALVCNIGDMLEKATGGVYRSTPHRVRSPLDADRVSMPYFFDPGWDTKVERLGDGPGADPHRWDHADPHLFEGTYGDYVWSKVAKVFPDLA